MRSIYALFPLLVLSACGPSSSGGKGGQLPKPIEIAKDSQGSVFEHTPKTCGQGRVYVSAKAIHKNGSLSTAWASVEERFVTGSLPNSTDMQELQRMLKVLKEGGFSVGRDLEEIAVCIPARKEPVFTFGGSFGDKEVLPTFQAALQAASVEVQLDPAPSGSNGIGSVLHGKHKHDPWLGHVARGVLVGALDRKAIDMLTPAVDRKPEWAVADDDIVMVAIPGNEWSPKIDARLKLAGEMITLDVTIGLKKGDEDDAKDPKELEKKMRKELDKMTQKMAKGPLAPLVEGVRSAKITIDGMRVTVSSRVSTNQFVSALSSMNLGEMENWF